MELHCYIYIYIIHFDFSKKYDKILKTYDYFRNVNINVVFLFNFLLFYMQNIVIYFHGRQGLVAWCISMMEHFNLVSIGV